MVVSFFWCEEVIQQADNKVMAIGLLGDRKIMLSKTYVEEVRNNHKDQPIQFMFALERIGLYINISEEFGEYEPIGQFYAPSGKPHGESIGFGKIIIPENRSYNLLFRANPFPFPELGKYSFELKINERIFTSDITIFTAE